MINTPRCVKQFEQNKNCVGSGGKQRCKEVMGRFQLIWGLEINQINGFMQEKTQEKCAISTHDTFPINNMYLYRYKCSKITLETMSKPDVSTIRWIW